MKDVKLVKIWMALRWIFLWVQTTFLKLCRANHLSISQDRQCLTVLSYSNELEIKPSFKHRLENIFLSDSKRRYKLLEWVQNNLKTVKVTDFSTSWQDGIALCTLIEHVSPGFCPRFDLLRPLHRVNNCRLGIKLTQKYLRLRKMSITPEEMAIADSHTESKIMQMVQMIKCKDSNTKSFNSCKALVMNPTQSMKVGPLGRVVARGTGLKTGIVGQNTKFHILTTSGSDVDIRIDVCGPNNEKNSETIRSMNPGISAEELQNESENRPRHETRYISDKCGNVFLLQTSLENDNSDIISFNYQSVGEGRFQLTYIPRSSGIHVITIKSAGRNISGSPFHVKIRDFMRSLNPLSKIKPVPFDKIPSMQEPNLRSQSFEDIIHGGRRSTFQESKLEGVSRQLTVTRKRVVKRVMTKNGEKIIINETTPSPSMSRQSSVDISDYSEDEVVKRLPKSKIGKSPLIKLTFVSENNTADVKNSVEKIEHACDSDELSATDKVSEETKIQIGDFKSEIFQVQKDVGFFKIAKNHIIENEQISCEDNLQETHESGKGDKTPDEDLFTWETPVAKSSFSRSLSDGVFRNRHSRQVKKSNIGCKSSPKIKTLKSSSLRKACVYVSDKAFSKSSSYGSASENSSSDNHEDGITIEFQESNSRHRDNTHNAIQSDTSNTEEKSADTRVEENVSIEMCTNITKPLGKPMVDQSTQVKSDEIKLETGWRSEIRHLRRRKNFNNDRTAERTSAENNSRIDDKLLTLQNLVINSKQYLYPDKCDSSSVNETLSFKERPVAEHNLLIHGARQTSRQSTLDTNDSGIDDSLRDIFFSKYNNRHRRITRRSFPCEIVLDSCLTRSSTSAISYDEEESKFRLQNSYFDQKHDSTVLDSPNAVFAVSADNAEETSYSDSDINCTSPRSRQKIFIRARMQRHPSSSHKRKKTDQFTDILQKENTTASHMKSAGTSDGEVQLNSTNLNELSHRLQAQMNLEPTSTHTLNELRHRYHTSCSSDDSYCGFGLSTTQRKSFLGNIETFQNLTKNVDSGGEIALSDGPTVSDGHVLELSNINNSPVGLSSHDGCEQSSEMFLDRFIDNNPHLLPDPEHDHILQSSNGMTDEDTTKGVRAIGPALSLGIVDVKNHFQVYAERPGNGGLTVGVYGPQPHCVVETSINYTGSHIYEITYHVTLPGRYVISVKWAEKNIPNSPFVCQVE